MNYIETKKFDGICWMCKERIADSGEHKDKKSDLKYFMNTIDDPVIMKKNRKKWINGINSSSLKYEKVICQLCNNQRSKTIDNAYDLFSKKYILTLNKKLTNISFNDSTVKMDVFRYLAKNFCCRLVQNNVNLSQDLIDFVNGKLPYPRRLIIEPYSNYKTNLAEKNNLLINDVNSDIALFGRGSLMYCSNSNNKQEITIIYSTLICNNLIFEFMYLNQDVSLEKQKDLIEVGLIQYTKPNNIPERVKMILKNYV